MHAWNVLLLLLCCSSLQEEDLPWKNGSWKAKHHFSLFPFPRISLLIRPLVIAHLGRQRRKFNFLPGRGFTGVILVHFRRLASNQAVSGTERDPKLCTHFGTNQENCAPTFPNWGKSSKGRCTTHSRWEQLHCWKSTKLAPNPTCPRTQSPFWVYILRPAGAAAQLCCVFFLQ